jgi:uncharacterized RDD family membrane protein YckC
VSDNNPPGGNPPGDPFGQPPGEPFGNPAGATPPSGPPSYGQPDPAGPYGAAGYGAPGYGNVPAPTANYANWGQRALGYLIDFCVALPGTIISSIGNNMSAQASLDGETSGAGTLLTLVGAAISIGIFVWNQCLKQGRTGQTVGKGVIGIKLVGEATGQPIGAGMSFVRQIAHILDALPCLLGYLWPLWDNKRQTFADKILSTVVIEAPKQ